MHRCLLSPTTLRSLSFLSLHADHLASFLWRLANSRYHQFSDVDMVLYGIVWYYYINPSIHPFIFNDFTDQTLNPSSFYRPDTQSIHPSIPTRRSIHPGAQSIHFCHGLIFPMFAHVLVFFNSSSELLQTTHSIHPSEMLLFSPIHFQCSYRPDTQSIRERVLKSLLKGI